MRGLTRRWIVRETSVARLSEPGVFDDSNAGTSDSRLEEPGYPMPPLMQRVLAARGLVDPGHIKQFCEPKLTALHEPALLHDIDRGVARIIDAIKRDELIIIYGDYDVDGITATAILFHVIKTAQPAARIRSYVPHRLDEGYGLNCEALRQLKSEGANLIISVDCGITAVKSAQTAREIGLDLIITDHHEFSSGSPALRAGSTGGGGSESRATLPLARALIHPRLTTNDIPYPFADLCGAGVAFKLAWHFACAWCNSQRVSEALQTKLIEMLPLVALGTIADVAPLVGENRTLTAFGLRFMRDTPLHGLRALIEASGLMDAKIDSEKVGFLLAPRLNACGRMGHAAQAVRMLTEASPEEAAEIARQLTAANQHRQSVERHIFDQAAQLAEDSGMTRDDRRAIVLAHEGWHPGVVGIVCARMVDRFGRPAVLLQKGRELCKGSARSIDGYSIHEGLAAAADLLTTFGGHAMAAGLSLHPQNLDALAERLIEHANRSITVDQLTPAVTIDCDAALSELDLTTARRLLDLAPFGRENKPPTLRVQGATIAEAPKQIGVNGKHLTFRVRQDSPTGENGGGSRRWLRAVWWNAGQRAGDFAAGMRVDLVIEPQLNTWNGQTSVEALVRDVRILNDQQIITESKPRASAHPIQAAPV